MSHPVHYIPAGYHTVTPYLYIKGAAKALEFYKKAFGAVEIMRLAKDDDRIGHAEIKIGDSRIMLADEYPEMNVYSPTTLKGSAVMLHLYVEDVDTFVNRAVVAGAQLLKPVADQFYGDRNGSLVDPFGHLWGIATHKEDVSAEEIERRLAAMSAK